MTEHNELARTCPQCGKRTLNRHTLPTRQHGGGGWDMFEHCTTDDCGYEVERGAPAGGEPRRRSNALLRLLA
jgi:hypothetical protein